MTFDTICSGCKWRIGLVTSAFRTYHDGDAIVFESWDGEVLHRCETDRDA